MLKLKFQYFDHLMQRADSLEKTPMLGKTEGSRRGWQRMRWLDGITDSVDRNLSKLWEAVKERSLAWCSPWGHRELDRTERLNSKTKWVNTQYLARCGGEAGECEGIPGNSEFKPGAGFRAGGSDAQQSGRFSTAQRRWQEAGSASFQTWGRQMKEEWLICKL